MQMPLGTSGSYKTDARWKIGDDPATSNQAVMQVTVGATPTLYDAEWCFLCVLLWPPAEAIKTFSVFVCVTVW